eukprot:TRINITY_DN823_c0_g1_i1.p1 TRINITY_DN823_c0_g1~~TRINITY_DN823_c0_g1_i1.p1  ORF type:complete len:237 (+),score=85.98 TRINITY_DN823_c0_g1_i1:51-761(+)
MGQKIMHGDGWTVFSTKKKQKKKPQQKKKTIAPEEQSNVEEDQPLLNDVFQMNPSSRAFDNSESDQKQQYIIPEEEEWKEVSNSKSRRKKRKPKEKEVEVKPKKKEVVQKPKPKKIQKTEAQILREKDEKRARKEFKSGDHVEYFHDFTNQWVKATIVNTTADSLTITWDGHQKPMNRNDPLIKPIWNSKSQRYYPLPKKQKKKKTVVEQEPKKPEKKKKYRLRGRSSETAKAHRG